MKTEKEKEIDTTTEIIIKDSLNDKDTLKDKDKENMDDIEKNKQLIENLPPKKEKEPVQRTVSAPPTITEVTACCSCYDVFNMSGILLTRLVKHIHLTACRSSVPSNILL